MNKKIMNAALATTAFFLLAGSHGGGCGAPPIINNNGFDLWCGDTLCYWAVDKGSIAPAPTWHSEDKAVDMIGNAVAISQYSRITDDDYTCIEFELLGNIEPSATVHIEMDIFGDGSVEWRQPLPASVWSRYSYLVRLPNRYEGIMFRITKDGPGRALLAQIVAKTGAGQCAGMTPLSIANRPNGATCSFADECLSGFCHDTQFPTGGSGTCGECGNDNDCSFGQVCGSALPEQLSLGLYQACGEPYRHQLGERCVNDNECASSSCCDNVCSTCCNSNGCDAGETCTTPPRANPESYWATPHQCDPENGGATTGDECLVDTDCASGSCNGNGELKVCLLDGRLCDDNNDCSLGLACISIGAAGARCE